MKRRQKECFLTLRSSKITVTKEKEGEKERARSRKGGEEKKTNKQTNKNNGCTNGYLGRKKKLLDAKGPFGGNVIKKSG